MTIPIDTFRFVAYAMVNGWLQVSTKAGRAVSLNLATVTAVEYDPERNTLILHGPTTTRLISSLEQTGDGDALMHAAEARAAALQDLHIQVVAHLVRAS